MVKAKFKYSILKKFLLINAIFLFFWWPMSHWFYPDFYHNLLGFEPNSYQPEMVKIIGTCGIIPVLLLIFSSLDPKKNKHSLITLIVFGVFISFTYTYLIFTGKFPILELINVGLSLFVVIIIIILYPWKRGYGHDSCKNGP